MMKRVAGGDVLVWSPEAREDPRGGEWLVATTAAVVHERIVTTAISYGPWFYPWHTNDMLIGQCFDDHQRYGTVETSMG